MRGNILVVDDEISMREFLSVMLQGEGHHLDLAANGGEALSFLEKNSYDLVLLDLVMPDIGGQEVLERAKQIDPDLLVVVVTAHGSIGSAIEAMKAGAYDYMQKPFQIEEIRMILGRALDKRYLARENIQLKRELQQRYQFNGLIGSSPSMLELYAWINRVKDAKTNVLVLGESGTGKELVARAIHYNGNRKDRPFVAINCAAIPETLLESELFGHKRGAFTGAIADRMGLLESGQRGTVFLDEIGELPFSLQVKLLRVLQERTVRRVGGTEDIEIDVRVIAASNRNLEKEVQEGRFRDDLYYRLNVIQVQIPPLRERREDIPMLAQYFLEKYAKESSKPIQKFSKEAMALLLSYGYPGNVRELENVVERAVALESASTILPESLRGLHRTGLGAVSPMSGDMPLPLEGLDLETAVGEFEKGLLVQALKQTEGFKKKAAELLQLSFRSLRYRLVKYGLDSGKD
ncbi:MAG: sigma-54-dependent Fis family transcriptional regulator [Deltaproteobacteria bacterium]|nr:sigma-54-dependent Fis family transcriptional regulator [Deltaproteobacteria bacterium]